MSMHQRLNSIDCVIAFTVVQAVPKWKLKKRTGKTKSFYLKELQFLQFDTLHKVQQHFVSLEIKLPHATVEPPFHKELRTQRNINIKEWAPRRGKGSCICLAQNHTTNSFYGISPKSQCKGRLLIQTQTTGKCPSWSFPEYTPFHGQTWAQFLLLPTKYKPQRNADGLLGVFFPGSERQDRPSKDQQAITLPTRTVN